MYIYNIIIYIIYLLHLIYIHTFRVIHPSHPSCYPSIIVSHYTGKNVLVFEEGKTVKLTDFGSALKKEDIEVKGNLTGFTPNYSAPEVRQMDNSDADTIVYLSPFFFLCPVLAPPND